MEHILSVAVRYAVPVVEACGALVILVGVGRAIFGYVCAFIGIRSDDVAFLRLQLGQSLVMGLEFQVAADILKTAISPTWNDILLLSALIGLRTVLNFFLEREIDSLAKRLGPRTISDDQVGLKKL